MRAGLSRLAGRVPAGAPAPFSLSSSAQSSLTGPNQPIGPSWSAGPSQVGGLRSTSRFDATTPFSAVSLHCFTTSSLAKPLVNPKSGLYPSSPMDPVPFSKPQSATPSLPGSMSLQHIHTLKAQLMLDDEKKFQEYVAHLPPPGHPEYYIRRNWITHLAAHKFTVACDFVAQVRYGSRQKKLPLSRFITATYGYSCLNTNILHFFNKFHCMCRAINSLMPLFSLFPLRRSTPPLTSRVIATLVRNTYSSATPSISSMCASKTSSPVPSGTFPVRAHTFLRLRCA